VSAFVPIEKNGFSISPSLSDDRMTVKLTGSCDSQSLPLLGPFLERLHVEALRVRAKCVVLDCENLYFMNSAAVKCFVIWLTKVKTLAPIEGYSVRARTNPYLAWQQRTFGAIRRSTPDVLTIEQ
jgi:hypothetical protein